MPKVSIIMPSLNVRPYIEECVESVLQQTLEDIEILCVDAGSDDGTLEVLRACAEKDARLRVIVSEKRSYGHQMNLGLDAATGEYLGIVETDDYIASEMFAELYALAVREELDVVKGDFCRFYGEGRERKFEYAQIAAPDRYDRVLDPSADPSLLDNRSLYSWAGLYRIAFLRDKEIRHNETPGASYQDNGFWFQVFSQARRLYFVPKPYYYLRRDNPNSSINSRSKVYCMCEEYDFIRDFLRKNPELEARFAPWCALLRMKNYDFTFSRVAPEYKREFLERYVQDFRRLQEQGELRRELYTDEQWARLQKIMAEPDDFFFTHCPRELLFDALPAPGSQTEQVEELMLRLRAARTLLEQAAEDKQALLASKTYRMGLFATWLPRKLRGALYCVKEHGLNYTMGLLSNKIRKLLCR